MNNVEFYKCEICGNIIEVVKGNGASITCCGQKMTKLEPNTVDAATEKHLPAYEVVGDEIVVRVGSVEHPMTEEHYIMWVGYLANNEFTKVSFKPGDKIEEHFKYVPGSKLYAYCNLHGLWETNVV